jgi:peptidyl-tRNA hydrolase
MEKGPRDDDMHFTLRVGQTITVMLKNFMYGGDRDVFSNDKGYTEIPPFSMVDLVVSPTNNDDPK